MARRFFSRRSTETVTHSRESSPRLSSPEKFQSEHFPSGLPLYSSNQSDGSTDHTGTSGESFVWLYQPAADGATPYPDVPIGVLASHALSPEEISRTHSQRGKSR